MGSEEGLMAEDDDGQRWELTMRGLKRWRWWPGWTGGKRGGGWGVPLACSLRGKGGGRGETLGWRCSMPFNSVCVGGCHMSGVGEGPGAMVGRRWSADNGPVVARVRVAPNRGEVGADRWAPATVMSSVGSKWFKPF
jgi:hypothetical protein